MTTAIHHDFNQTFRYMNVYRYVLFLIALGYAPLAEIILLITNQLDHALDLPVLSMHWRIGIFVGCLILLLFLTFLRAMLYLRWQKKQPWFLARKENHLANLLLAEGMINLGVANTVGVVGLSIFLITENRLDFYPFFILSIVFNIILFPRYRTWQKLVAAAPA